MIPEQSAWYADETNPVNLKALLENPVFKQALEVVRRTYRPTRSLPAMENNVIAASANHYNAGASDALDALIALTTSPPVPARRPSPRQLEPITPLQ